MSTTNSKVSVKVNQILPIMQEHFGENMNLARIKLGIISGRISYDKGVQPRSSDIRSQLPQ